MCSPPCLIPSVSNSSLLPVNGVFVQLRMPAELTFNDTRDVEPNPGGCSSAGSALVCDVREEALWNLGTLAAGESRTITINALVDITQLDGNLIATPVRVTATNVDAEPIGVRLPPRFAPKTTDHHKEESPGV